MLCRNRSSDNSASEETQKRYQNITLEKVSEHVAHIKLNRPKKRNAVDFSTCDDLCRAFEDFENNKEWRCGILSGEGRDFTNGLDLAEAMKQFGEFAEIDDIGRKAKGVKNMIEKLQSPFKTMDGLSKPLICVVHGNCVGLGMELTACCDIRYCSEDASFSIREVKIGICADVGSLQKLPLLMANQSYLRELVYTGRVMSPADALKYGLVSKICPSKQSTFDEALALAQEIAKLSPIAVQGSKVNLRFSTHQPFGVGLEYAAVWNMAMMQSKDVADAITSIVTKSDDTKYDPY